MYHEYTTPDGRVVRRHYNSTKSAGKPVEDFTFTMQQIYEGAHPNSELWASAARNAITDLHLVLGDPLHREFMDALFPDHTIEEYSWKTICHMIDRAYAQAAVHKVRDIQALVKAAINER